MTLSEAASDANCGIEARLGDLEDDAQRLARRRRRRRRRRARNDEARPATATSDCGSMRRNDESARRERRIASIAGQATRVPARSVPSAWRCRKIAGTARDRCHPTHSVASSGGPTMAASRFAAFAVLAAAAIAASPGMAGRCRTWRQLPAPPPGTRRRDVRRRLLLVHGAAVRQAAGRASRRRRATSGGTTKRIRPTRKCRRACTGHTEAVQVLYDPAKVSYEKLLDVFWHNIDPTVKDRQFCDVGTQYRTGIFVHTRRAAAGCRGVEGGAREVEAVQGTDRHADRRRDRVLAGRGVSPGLLREESGALQLLPDRLRTRRAPRAAVGVVAALRHGERSRAISGGLDKKSFRQTRSAH